MELRADLIIRNLKAYRKKAGLSQAELAEKLGVNQVSISAYETGKNRPRAGKMDSLLDILTEYFPDGLPILNDLDKPIRSGDGRPFGSIRTICPHCQAANYHYIETPIPRLEIKCITCGCEFRPFDKGPGPTKSCPEPGGDARKKHGNWHKWDRAKESR
jgi:transcriptional regulator with XRE-family HTH domain